MPVHLSENKVGFGKKAPTSGGPHQGPPDGMPFGGWDGELKTCKVGIIHLLDRPGYWDLLSGLDGTANYFK
jgi:hypothetical protein